MIRVLVEPEAFWHPRCGVARYWSVVCRGLTDAGMTVDLPLLGMDATAMTQRRPDPPGRTAFKTRLWARAQSLSRQIFLHKLRQQAHQVVLPTAVHPDTALLELAHRLPMVLVCHDTMRSLPIPGGAIDGWSDPLHRLLYLARRAARVVCVSERTRADLLHAEPSLAERAVVVPSGNLLTESGSGGAPVHGLPDRYLLFVGSRQIRKNFHGLVQAVAPLLGTTTGLALVCTGSLSCWERDHLRAQGVASAVLGLEVTDAQLVTLYRRALALVYPSYYEGFGLPVLEAMTLGCPVIASGTSSLSELVGEAGLTVDPFDAQSIRQAVTRVLHEPELRARLSHAGRERSRLFTRANMMAGLVREITRAATAAGL